MKITDLYKENKRTLSFEIFPPKRDDELRNIDATLEVLSELKPDFISVTFGAGGSSNCNRTIELAKKIKYEYGIEPVVHLTCLHYDRHEIDEFAHAGAPVRGIDHLNAPATRPREAERAVLLLAPGLPPGGVEEKHRVHDAESIP